MKSAVIVIKADETVSLCGNCLIEFLKKKKKKMTILITYFRLLSTENEAMDLTKGPSSPDRCVRASTNFPLTKQSTSPCGVTYMSAVLLSVELRK